MLQKPCNYVIIQIILTSFKPNLHYISHAPTQNENHDHNVIAKLSFIIDNNL